MSLYDIYFFIFDINQIKMHQTRMQRFFAQQFYIDTKSLRFIKLRTIQKLKIREWQKKLVEIAGHCGAAFEPRSGVARKTRPFGRLRDFGRGWSQGDTFPSPKNLQTKISSTKKNRPLDNRIIGIKGNLCKKCTSSHESEYLSFFILSIVEHSQYENFASLLIHDVIKPVIFHRHYTNIA